MLNPQSPKDAWTRRTTLDGTRQDQMTEIWEYRGATHCIDVTVGKRLDVLSLKGTSLREIREYAAFLEKSAARLYALDAPHNTLESCPCCGQATRGASVAMKVFEVPYVRCQGCGHVYVSEQPSQSVLDSLFTESALHSSEYTDIDPAAQDFRIRQIAEPKLGWARRQYERVFNRAPSSLVDVGAGGGHFVTAAARAGMDVVGYERSASSRRFAKSAFGVELRPEDFHVDDASAVDLITFWGLLEYVPQPRRLLATARRRLATTAGMLIVEVPRFNCVGSAAQEAEGAVVARHMDPTTHVNCFTDASLCTALVEEGFRPVAAWYFGMDIYELFVQIALKLDDETVLEKIASMLNGSQAALDRGRQCDDLIVAAVPID